MKEMKILKEVNTARCLKPENVTGPPQLHTFSDGGEDAFGSFVFIRWPTVYGIEVGFIAAKAFVVPGLSSWEQLLCQGWCMKYLRL